MEKIKLFYESERGKDILVIIIIILVGICSFFLGRLSNEGGSKGLKIDYTEQNASALGSVSNINQNPSIEEKTTNHSGGNYFASKRGKKYYTLGCSAGKSIKEENRIYFENASMAENAGYTASSSCN